MGLSLDYPYVETGDEHAALSAWRATGASAENTDRGRLHIRLGLTTPGQLEAYRDESCTAPFLVASGPDAAPGADAVLTEAGGSGLQLVVRRSSGPIGNGTTTPGIKLYVWLTSERDLREIEEEVYGHLITGEGDLSIALRACMREFLTEFASVYPPPPLIGHPNRHVPPMVEPGQAGEIEEGAAYFWSLNHRGDWELVGLQNGDDYREWATAWTLAWLCRRKVRSATEADPVYTRFLFHDAEAKRQWAKIKAWLDSTRTNQPERHPTTGTMRLRRA